MIHKINKMANNFFTMFRNNITFWLMGLCYILYFIFVYCLVSLDFTLEQAVTIMILVFGLIGTPLCIKIESMVDNDYDDYLMF